MSYAVSFAARDNADVVTLTLDSVAGLAVGQHVVVYNVGNNVDGHHVLTGIDAGESQVTFSDNGATFAELAVSGVLVAEVTWIDSDDVQLVVGNVSDTEYLDACVAAANDFAYRRRWEAGYMDNPTVAPGAAAKQGTTLYAVALYREKGSVDSFQSFEQMPLQAPTGSMGQILRLLGVGRPQVG